MNSLVKVKNKVARAAGIFSGTCMAMTCRAVDTLCGSGSGSGGNMFTSHEVDINVDNVDATTTMNKVVSVIVGIFICLGLFTMVTGFFAYLEAKSEENAMGESKGIKKMVVGIVMIAAPVIVKFIFS